MHILIGYEPKNITEGTVVRLTASRPSKDYDYKYEWTVKGDEPEPGVIFWNTEGLQPGGYRVGVHVEVDPPGTTTTPAEASGGYGEEVLAVLLRPVSSHDVERLVDRASDFARHLKHNLDEKMDDLTGEVSKSVSSNDVERLADRAGKFAQHLKDNLDQKMDNLTGAVSQVATGVGQPFQVVLQRSATVQTDDQGLWSAIRHHTEMIGFKRYSEFIDRVLCEGRDQDGARNLGDPTIRERRADLLNRPTIHGVDAFELLRTATEVFLILECGIQIRPGAPLNLGEEGIRLGTVPKLADITKRLQDYLGRNSSLPYLDRIVDALLGPNQANRRERLPYCDTILRNRFTCPSLIELIWSYWHEEGMLVQTLNAIALRFQNRHRGGARDPLAHLEIDPLRPLNNLFWGYIQSEYKRLTVPRRAYEYDHHYGLTLYGKAVPALRSADSRSKFLEAFHNLLYRTSVFYQEDADTTVIADGFALLTALREVHLLLAEGAHNQFGDLPWTARVEMLIEQWLMARPEIQQFLRGRAMVPYREAWMGQVDTMKKLQGWTDTTITHFNELAVWGEQIVLSIRYGDWIGAINQEQAKNWARYWRPEIQGYIHAYRAVTGVDLTADTVGAEKASERYLQPSVHLRNRLVEQQRRVGGA